MDEKIIYFFSTLVLAIFVVAFASKNVNGLAILFLLALLVSALLSITIHNKELRPEVNY